MGIRAMSDEAAYLVVDDHAQHLLIAHLMTLGRCQACKYAAEGIWRDKSAAVERIEVAIEMARSCWPRKRECGRLSSDRS